MTASLSVPILPLVSTADTSDSWRLVLLIAAIIFGLLVAAGFIAWRERHVPAQTGKQTLIGTVGIARQPLDPDGLIYLAGELWAASSDPAFGNKPIAEGEAVVITGNEQLRMLVRPATQAEQLSGASAVVSPVQSA